MENVTTNKRGIFFFTAGSICTLAVVTLLVWSMPLFKNINLIISPIGNQTLIPTVKPLEKYTYPNLKAKVFNRSNIEIGKILKEDKDFTSYTFYYTTDGKKVSGLMNVPSAGNNLPVIVMYRGFVAQENFTTGEGTRRTAEAFAQNGFITLAPDFLGYGESDNPANNAMEERFETYTTAIDLLVSVTNINSALQNLGSNITADPNKTGIWGHSNGGHIALATAEISGFNYPLVLWNPVTKPFPYSILYFTDEYDDHGKGLRKLVADFEKDYDVDKYSPTSYLDWINSPIQLHQAVDDEAVPKRWSDQFEEELIKAGKKAEYYTYPGENHNFLNGSWPKVLERSISFFRKHFNK